MRQPAGITCLPQPQVVRICAKHLIPEQVLRYDLVPYRYGLWRQRHEDGGVGIRSHNDRPFGGPRNSSAKSLIDLNFFAMTGVYSS